MKLVVLLVFLAIFVQVFGSKKQKWEQFKLIYNKTYANAKEERRRFFAFKLNLKEINTHNKKYKNGFESYKKGINNFADMTQKEFTKRYNLWLPDDAPIKNYETSENDTLPDLSNITKENFDWRKFGAVTPAKDQGSCGACWIFSAVAVLEGFHSKKTGKLVPLSEQHVIDCFSNQTCYGGYPERTLYWVQKHGISTEKDYPYKEKHVKCEPDESKLLNISFQEIVQVNNTEEDLRIALAEHGPIVVSLYVTSRWRFYKSGVWYDSECAEVTNHSMLLVGYGIEKGREYWLIKNSWGRDWGENGYIKIARNRHKNYCGLTAESFYIV